MKSCINALVHGLGNHLSLSRCHLKCTCELVVALLRCESVNLRRLSLRLEGEAKLESQYRRLQRFFPQSKV